jgi:hypothetical protein
MHDDTNGTADMAVLPRRRFTALAGAGLITALAGCSGEGDSSGESGSNGSSATQATAGGGTTTTATSTSGGQTTAESTTPSADTTTTEPETETETDASTSTTSTDTTSASSSSSDDAQIESVPETLDVLEHELFEDDYTAGVRGEIENVSDETLSYVEVEVYFQDESGTRIGDALANTQDLPPGGTWAFEALYVGSKDAEAIEDYTLTVSDSALD